MSNSSHQNQRPALNIAGDAGSENSDHPAVGGRVEKNAAIPLLPTQALRRRLAPGGVQESERSPRRFVLLTLSSDKVSRSADLVSRGLFHDETKYGTEYGADRFARCAPHNHHTSAREFDATLRETRPLHILRALATAIRYTAPSVRTQPRESVASSACTLEMAAERSCPAPGSGERRGVLLPSSDDTADRETLLHQ